VDSVESKASQDDLWFKITRDEYMQYAVEEVFFSIRYILTSILDNEGRKW
jgi:callose synthase